MRIIRTVPVLLALATPALRGENWPQWRGPFGTGVSPEKGFPVEWGSNKNIAWRADLGGLGVSSPVAWSDRVFVTYQIGASALRQGRHPTFIQEGDPADAGETPLGGARAQGRDGKLAFVVAAYRASDGGKLWEYKMDAEGDLPEVHEKRNLATSSPVTDGEHVYAWFSNGQIAALDMNGKAVWTRHLGKEYSVFDLDWGHSSSPVLYRDRLILMCYQRTSSYLLALDKRTGKELWKVERGQDLKSYSTPLVIEARQGPELIVNSSESVEAIDPATGKSLWKYVEPARFAVPS